MHTVIVVLEVVSSEALVQWTDQVVHELWHLSNPFAWGPWPERLAALASLELGEFEAAVHHARRALRCASVLAELAGLLGRATDALLRRRGVARAA